jgi:4-amino-4-deoxy-L-arabinose transferase-like glycosyltransferase
MVPSYNRGLAAAIIIAVCLRMLLPIASWALNGDTSRFHANDTAGYVTPARHLLESGDFATGDGTEIIRTPGYPLLLLPGLLFGQLEWVTVSLQAFLAGLSVLLVFGLAHTLADDHRTALIAAWIYAIEPLSVIYSGVLLTETLFAVLILLFLRSMLAHLRTGGLSHLLLSSAFLSGASFVRPIAYPLLLVVGAFLLIRPVRQLAFRRRLLNASLFAAAGLMIVLPWQIRNGLRTGFYGVSAISAISLYFYQGAAVRAAVDEVPFSEMQKHMGHAQPARYFSQHPGQLDWTAGQRYAYLRAEGIRAIAQHPLVYAQIHLKGMVRSLADPGAIDALKYLGLYPHSGGLLGIAVDQGLAQALRVLFQKHPLVIWLSLVLGAGLLVSYGLAILGIRAAPGGPFVPLLLLVAVYFVLLSGGPQSLGRFRHPAMPIVAIFAGMGLSGVAAFVHRSRTRSPSSHL